jgi:prolipoprotein diacylglyceryltransferase
MFPILAQFGDFKLYTYTALLDLGVLMGFIALWRAAPSNEARARWLDAGLVATLGGLLGARLLYVFVHANFYFTRSGEIFRVEDGGLAWPGAVAGALLGGWLYAQSRHIPFGALWDAVALPLVLLGLFTWGGCLAAGCAYGFEVSPGAWPAWLTLNAPDLYGVIVPRFPTAASGILWSVIGIAALYSVPRRWPVGARGAYALGLIALGAFGLSFTRGDPSPLINGLRLDTVGSALVLIATSVTFAIRVAQPSAPPVAPNVE